MQRLDDKHGHRAAALFTVFKTPVDVMDREQEYIQRLRTIIGERYGSGAEHIRSVPLRENLKGKIVWEGTVEVFRLIRHSGTNRCFAWSLQNTSDVVTVLGIPPIIGPATAVQAALSGQLQQGAAVAMLSVAGVDECKVRQLFSCSGSSYCSFSSYSS